VENVAVQGVYAVTEVVDALRRLDRDPAVDVIVVARGGGSVEDLLPFSDEAMVRAVAACVTPVVSAIGHEPDTPLIDLVADVRASTPTDAARRVVPDVREEQSGLTRSLVALRRAAGALVERESGRLDALRSRPVLADPVNGLVRPRLVEILGARDRSRRAFGHLLDRATAELVHAQAQVRALSPAATLDRGYAVVQLPDGTVVRDPDQVEIGTAVRVRVAGGELAARRVPAGADAAR
jgi:exodeoxyribonuclease VII large subunit